MPLEVLLGLAGLLGYSAAKDLAAEIAARGTSWSKRKLDDHVAKVKTFAYDAAIARILAKYYAQSAASSGLKRYRVLTPHGHKETTVFTTPERIGLCLPPSEVDCQLDIADRPKVPRAISDFAPTVMARFEKLGVQVTGDPVFRITGASLVGTSLSFRFVPAAYSEYRFTTGLLEDELKDCLAAHDGDTDAILKHRSKTLPIREAILPGINSLTEYSGRISIGGPGILLALARGKPFNDFVIPIQMRSQRVGDNQGSLAVIPKGCHQHMLDPKAEIGLQWTIYRELYEEVYGGKDAESPGHSFAPDWYFEFPPLRYFREHEGAFKDEIVGFGLNAVTGNYEFAALLAILDAWYFTEFKAQMKLMWEQERIMLLSTKDPHRIVDLLWNGNWALESIFHFVEGLIRLREIAPERVDCPDLTRDLVID